MERSTAGSRPSADRDARAEGIAVRAAAVLRANDRGSMTVAAAGLYPHMWSWDAAFVTIGLASIDVSRAIRELGSLLRAQWSTGMIPHIVFTGADGYEPGPDRWRVDGAAPAHVKTSGICQPPVHAIALRRILDRVRHGPRSARAEAEAFAARAFEPLARWHRWLATARDPERRGLVEIAHSWESGMDNAPRWDSPYAAVVPRAGLAPVARPDLRHVTDSGQRPTDVEYARYLWLVDQLSRARYDDRAVRDTVDFRVGDVFMSAILAVAAEELASIGDGLGRRGDAAQMREIAERFRRGVGATISPETGLARDYDVRSGRWLDSETVAGFAPLLIGAADQATARQRELFWGPRWCGHPLLRHALPPSTSPCSPAFRPGRYWRGPVWPVISWLFAWAFRRSGDSASAERLRTASLDQLGDLSFSEYYEPVTAAPLGSRHQSWTAAVALDWVS